ncbi:hypothetical protein [Streptomyces prunicolor]|uniref:hypothetical protein n=1 Tax=Streptomyces prunicolor TaxID=67348 RepID=UPI00131A1C6D|nr:hypothetical protein [Streptomyces prunicolor]
MEKSRTFRQFVISFRGEPNQLGDLAADYTLDWKDGFRPVRLTPLNLYQRLEKHGACSGAFEAVTNAAERWCAETGNRKPERELREYITEPEVFDNFE